MHIRYKLLFFFVVFLNFTLQAVRPIDHYADVYSGAVYRAERISEEEFERSLDVIVKSEYLPSKSPVDLEELVFQRFYDEQGVSQEYTALQVLGFYKGLKSQEEKAAFLSLITLICERLQ